MNEETGYYAILDWSEGAILRNSQGTMMMWHTADAAQDYINCDGSDLCCYATIVELPPPNEDGASNLDAMYLMRALSREEVAEKLGL